MVLNILGDWYLAENQRLGNLGFFNRIGQLRLFADHARFRDVGSDCAIIWGTLLTLIW
jgi:hypothetical protein